MLKGFLFDNLVLMDGFLLMFVGFFPYGTLSIFVLHLCVAIKELVNVLLLNRIYIQYKSTKLTKYIMFALSSNSTDIILVIIQP